MIINYKNIHKQEKQLDLTSPRIMGILNCTPDSFSDGGKYKNLDDKLFAVEQMINDGAYIIDVGGESTRPNADIVSEEQELDRTIATIEAIKQRFDILVSIDSSKAKVLDEAAKVGVDIFNDVRALTQENALNIAVKYQLPVCLMHMQGTPQTMQQKPHYENVVDEVFDFLKHRILECEKAGLRKDLMMIDPGFGFGKTLVQNYQILQNLSKFQSLNLPILTGLSNKSMLGNLLNKKPNELDTASATAALLCVINDAKIVRVHNVSATADALKIYQKMITS